MALLVRSPGERATRAGTARGLSAGWSSPRRKRPPSPRCRPRMRRHCAADSTGASSLPLRSRARASLPRGSRAPADHRKKVVPGSDRARIGRGARRCGARITRRGHGEAVLGRGDKGLLHSGDPLMECSPPPSESSPDSPGPLHGALGAAAPPCSPPPGFATPSPSGKSGLVGPGTSEEGERLRGITSVPATSIDVHRPILKHALTDRMSSARRTETSWACWARALSRA